VRTCTSGSLPRSAAMLTVELTLCWRNLFKVDIAQKLSVERRTEGRSDVATTTETDKTDRASDNGQPRCLDACYLCNALGGW